MTGFDIFPLASFIVLIVMISGRIILLKRKGIRVSSSTGKKNKPALFLYPLFLALLLLWLFEIVKPLFHFRCYVLPGSVANLLTESAILKLSGVIIIVFAMVLLLLTLFHFKNSLRFGLDENNQGEMITNGIFSHSRNPFFITINLYFAGIAMIFPNLFFICFTALSFASTHFFILKEEKFLRKHYGKKYDDYMKKVRRYF